MGSQVRRLLGYSSIVHGGWLGLSARYMWLAFNLYLSIYLFINLLLFICIKFIDFKVSFAAAQSNINSKLKPYAMILLLSLGGLPPFLGFVSKFAVIGFLARRRLFLALIVLIIGSLISLYYYLILFMRFLINCGFRYLANINNLI